MFHFESLELLSDFFFFFESDVVLILMMMIAASENPFKSILKTLEKPGGGEFGKYYSLTALNDPRIG